MTDENISKMREIAYNDTLGGGEHIQLKNVGGNNDEEI